MLLLLYRPMTPCCFCGSMGFVVSRSPVGAGDDGDGGNDA
jgi:hypothetical protein